LSVLFFFVAQENGAQLPMQYGTLIVCPASVLGQWKHEIKRFTGKNLSVIRSLPFLAVSVSFGFSMF
jgi:hypothetical protein